MIKNIKIENSQSLYLNISNKDNPISRVKSKYLEEVYIDKPEEYKPYFVIYVTNDCNKNCIYCFNKLNRKPTNINPTYSVDTLINFILSFNSPEIGIRFFGGEPILNFKFIKKTIESIKKTNIIANYDIFTNGELLTTKQLNYLKDNNCKIYISLPGSKKEIDDFDQLDAAIQNKIIELNPFGRMVWVPSKKQSLKDLIKYSIDKGYEIISFTLEWGKYDYSDSKSLIYKDLDEVARWYVENVNDKNFKYIGLHPFSGYIAKWLSGEYNSRACGCGDSMFSISTDGKIYPCHAFNENREYCSGEIEDLNVKRLFKSRLLTNSASCKNCDYNIFCKAKCYADFYFYNANMNHVNPFKCDYEKYIIYLSAKILYLISIGDNYKMYKYLIKRGSKKYDNN